MSAPAAYAAAGATGRSTGMRRLYSDISLYRAIIPVEKVEEAKEKLRRRNNVEREGLHIVMLEGPGGANKGGLLARLQALGYTTHNTRYIDLYKKYPSYDTFGGILGVRWAAACIDAVEALHRRYEKEPSSFLGGLAFVHRSPLSPRIHYRAKYGIPDTKYGDAEHIIMAARELADYGCSVILCKADPEATSRTLSERRAQAGNVERALRERLGEDDARYQKWVLDLYEENGLFWPFRGVSVVTTDSERAASALLRVLE
eukprot:tig00000900_g5376.t1